MRSIFHLYALAALAALVLPVNAANPTVPDPATGDVFLAFRAATEPGSSTSYLVKLGPDTQFTTATASSSFDVTSLGALDEDLKAAYGEEWSTRPDLYWGIFAFRPNNGNAIVYASRERTVVITRSDPWPALALTSRNATANQISPVIQGIGGYKGRVSTDNSSIATFQTNSSDATSYYKQVATPGTSDFGSLSQWSSIEGSFTNGVSGTVLDLHRISASGVTTVGSFTINSSGTVHFTNVIPSSPNTDSDGDGVSDENEALAGTDPHDATDFFRVQAIVPTATGIHVSFNVIAARNYTIDYSESLAADSWQTIATYSATSAALYEHLDTDATRLSKPRGFYRVRVSQ